MPFKTIATELLWFLNGETNIKWLLDRGCNIWNGDCYKNYLNKMSEHYANGGDIFDKEGFIYNIKTDNEFSDKWGEMGPIYGKQWRDWDEDTSGIDQIKNLIEQLKTNPDSRRLMVTAWNPTYIPHMVLPPCHYAFQVYTRELSLDERNDLLYKKIDGNHKREDCFSDKEFERETLQDCKAFNIPARAISLMWNQRSVDTFLGLPFNIASYGLLLEIIAKEVNMVPDELIGNLGDTHLYLNHIKQATQQMGSEISDKQLNALLREFDEESFETFIIAKKLKQDAIAKQEYERAATERDIERAAKKRLAEIDLPLHDRVPFELPTLKIKAYTDNGMIKPKLLPEEGDEAFYEVSDFILENYKSHPPIKAPLSN